MAVKTFEVLYGPVDVPMDAWEEQHRFVCDDSLPFNNSWSSWSTRNLRPDYIQEVYVRRPNYDLEYEAKHRGEKVKYKFMMRQTPENEDYNARAKEAGWVIWNIGGLESYNLPRLSEDRLTVTFYDTHSDAKKDRAKTMPVPRFLRKLGHHERDVAAICARENIPYATNFIPKIATTREEIRYVYINGPRSCMSGDPGHNIHYCEAYASEHIAVIYLVDKDDETHIAGRAVVNTRDKLYCSIYGATDQMETYFKKEGYTKDYSGLSGLKLPVLHYENGNRVDLPYIDYEVSPRLSSCGKFWEL